MPRCLLRYLSGLRKACAGADDFSSARRRRRLPEGSRDDASIVPYACEGLPGFAGYLCRRAAMHPSVGWRRQLPLQGRLWNTGAKKPSLQGEVDAPQAQTEGCGTLPGLYACGMFALRAGKRAPSNS